MSDLWKSLSSGVGVTMSALAMLAAIIAIVRVGGLRSFSKMSSFDFAVTVSIGSILGAVATSSTALTNGVIAVVALLGFQAAIAWGRSRGSVLQKFVDNTPLLLMDGPTLLPENLRSARVTTDDIAAKLREANVLELRSVRAVVLETTGDISVIHGDIDLDPTLLEGVRRSA